MDCFFTGESGNWRFWATNSAVSCSAPPQKTNFVYRDSRATFPQQILERELVHDVRSLLYFVQNLVQQLGTMSSKIMSDTRTHWTSSRYNLPVAGMHNNNCVRKMKGEKETRVTWCHWSRDHSIPKRPFPIGDPLVSSLFFLTVSEIFNGEYDAVVDKDLKRPLNKGQGHSFRYHAIDSSYATSYRLSIVTFAL